MTKDKSSEIHIRKSIVKSSGCEKVPGIKIDSKLFHDYGKYKIDIKL